MRDYRNTSAYMQLFSLMGIRELANPPKVKFERQIIKHESRVRVDERDKELLVRLKNSIVDIKLSDIDYDSNELINIRGRKACVYIRDQRYTISLNTESTEYRYHLCNCATLQAMRTKGREHRYLATQRSDGYFEAYDVTHVPPKKGIVRMLLCQHCVAILRQNNMHTIPFNLLEFFRKYDSSVPNTIKYVETIKEIQTYKPEHHDIAREYKNAVKYKCAMCGVNCKYSPRLLHLHHIDGNPANNDRYNLIVLCVDCHSMQPLHAHMKSNPRFNGEILDIMKLRREQGLLVSI